MKARNKVLLLMLSAVLLVGASVFGTLAYLTSSQTVTNTFSVGDVQITMDEGALDSEGRKIDKSAKRVQENTYHLIPGSTYEKDPTIHVQANSEPCYLFVKVENSLGTMEATDGAKGNIETQLGKNDWIKLSGVENTYYYKAVVNKAASIQDFVVFEEFKVLGTATGGQLAAYSGKQIVVTGYAVQKEGFTDAADAWSKTFGATP